MAVLEPKGCYVTRARIFRDSDIEVHIRWFRVPDGTPFHPDRHRWSGLPWRYNRYEETIGPGELTLRRLGFTWGAPPTMPQQLLGSPDWWANGVPISALETGTDMVRPGVCPPVACSLPATDCEVCDPIERVWTMGYCELPPGLTAEVLWKREGCCFTSTCADFVLHTKKKPAGVWSVSPTCPIPGLDSTLMVAADCDSFDSCCPGVS